MPSRFGLMYMITDSLAELPLICRSFIKPHLDVGDQELVEKEPFLCKVFLTAYNDISEQYKTILTIYNVIK